MKSLLPPLRKLKYLLNHTYTSIANFQNSNMVNAKINPTAGKRNDSYAMVIKLIYKLVADRLLLNYSQP